MIETVSAIMMGISASMFPCTMPGVTNMYDRLIKKSVRVYWPQPQRKYWCALKAQILAESGFDPNAVSPAGAKGVAQFMKPTWDEWTMRLKIQGARRNDVRYAIPVMAAYMGHLMQRWPVKRTDKCRRKMAQAAYNAGNTNIRRAQVLSGYQKCFEQIGEYLAKVTGSKNAHETRTYVKRIEKYFVMLMNRGRLPKGYKSNG